MFKFASVDRHLTVYHFDSDNLEYVSKSSVIIPANTGVPANSTIDKPPEEIEGKARVYRNGEWVQENDHRGTLVWRKSDAVSCVMGTLGEIPDEYTDVRPPETPFLTWSDDQWVQDEEKLKDFYVNSAKNKIEEGILYVKDRMDVLKYGEDLNMLTDEETKEYNQLKLFRFELSRIDVNEAPYIKWPQLDYVY